MNHVIYGTGNEISLLAMSSRKLTTIVADWVTLNGTVRKFVQRFPHEPDKTSVKVCYFVYFNVLR